MEQFELFELEDYPSSESEDKRVCSKCDKSLPLSSFSPNSGGNFLRPECKECNRAINKVRDRLRMEHGMPEEGYQCPVCEKTEDDVAGKGGRRMGAWCLDHCHDTHTFRGWLCHNCNRSLGGFNDSILTLERAIKYLKNHKEKK